MLRLVSRRLPRLTRSYHERVIDHYENPRNVGKFDKAEVDAGLIGTGLVGAPAWCVPKIFSSFRLILLSGDVMKLQLKIVDGRVEDAKFKTFGCGSAIASSSLATEWVKGKTVEECLQIKNTEIASHLALPPVKLHCSKFPWLFLCNFSLFLVLRCFWFSLLLTFLSFSFGRFFFSPFQTSFSFSSLPHFFVRYVSRRCNSSCNLQS